MKCLIVYHADGRWYGSEVAWKRSGSGTYREISGLDLPQSKAEIVRFAELVRTLRQRCPWDREQTHRSLTRHLLEETYEVLEAVQDLETAGAEGFVHLEEELGDLLFQVVFHATLAAEEGQFTLADVARGIHDKLVHRHPHVFAGVEADTPAQRVTFGMVRARTSPKRSPADQGLGEDGLGSRWMDSGPARGPSDGRAAEIDSGTVRQPPRGPRGGPSDN